MSKRTDRNLIVGLDIGTSKVVALVAEFKADGEPAFVNRPNVGSGLPVSSVSRSGAAVL